MGRCSSTSAAPACPPAKRSAWCWRGGRAWSPMPTARRWSTATRRRSCSSAAGRCCWPPWVASSCGATGRAATTTKEKRGPTRSRRAWSLPPGPLPPEPMTCCGPSPPLTMPTKPGNWKKRRIRRNGPNSRGNWRRCGRKAGKRIRNYELGMKSDCDCDNDCERDLLTTDH
ncbi:protein of unknown function [Candidatus Promineifilum breve]|uniref:Uncharacterized protein n=1 Tax=Candidatus Promineifilum breve TaxID=1806508 RepID=A0A160T229_9CHLR|nr:protein of unknown function [Candidatus Promineifilum breve]